MFFQISPARAGKGSKKRPKSIQLHKRKNSYKEAQEREPIDWYNLQERRKSIGNFEDEQRRAERQQHQEVAPRNSSSLGNILTHDDSDGAFLPRDEAAKSRQRYSMASPGKPATSAPLTPGTRAKSSKLRSSYHYERHPLSHSTTTILNECSSSKDPVPIVPNRCPGTPDVWVPRTIKA